MTINEQYTTYTPIRELIYSDKKITYEYEIDNVKYKIICINEFDDNWILKFDAIINHDSDNPSPAILMTSPSVVFSTFIKCIKIFIEKYIKNISTFTFQTKNDNIAKYFEKIQDVINKYIKSFEFISYLRLGFVHKFLYIKKSINIYKN